MTAPRPYSEEPRWREIGAILVIGGLLTMIGAIIGGWRPAELAGAALGASGLVIRIAAAFVWQP